MPAHLAYPKTVFEDVIGKYCLPVLMAVSICVCQIISMLCLCTSWIQVPMEPEERVGSSETGASLMWALRTKLRSSARAAISLGPQSNLWTPDNSPTLTVWVSLLHRLKSLWYWGRKEHLNLRRPMETSYYIFFTLFFYVRNLKNCFGFLDI